MNRLALALLLLASLTAPAWPGIHAALHAHESDAVAHLDAFDRDAAVHLGLASDREHGHGHPQLASVLGTRTAPPAVACAVPTSKLALVSAETVRLAPLDESPPPRIRPDRGRPDRPRGPPRV